MRAFLLPLALFAGTLLVLATGHPNAAHAADPLSGTWKTVAIEHAGRRLPDELVAKLPGLLQFNQGKVRVLLGDKVVAEGTYTVDEKATPKSLELSAMTYRGKEVKARIGLFELTDKGQLRIITANKADGIKLTNFDTTANPGGDLTIYEKAP